MGATFTDNAGFGYMYNHESTPYLGLVVQSKVVSTTGAYGSDFGSGSSYLEGINLVATFKGKITPPNTSAFFAFFQ